MVFEQLFTFFKACCFINQRKIKTYQQEYLNTTRGQQYKHFTTVIYCHFIALVSFCAINKYFSSNYHRMGVYYHGKKFCNIGHGGKLKYNLNLPWNSNHRKCRYCSKFSQYLYNIGHRSTFLLNFNNSPSFNYFWHEATILSINRSVCVLIIQYRTKVKCVSFI